MCSTSKRKETAPPTVLLLADENESIILFSDLGRAFRLRVSNIEEKEVRAAGQSITDLLPLRPNERIVAALEEEGGSYVAIVSERGRVRRVRSNYLGRNLIAGSTFHDVKDGGYLVDACWTPGDGDLFIATRQGKAIRFQERQIHSKGTLGMRVDPTDVVVAVTSVTEPSGVFLMSHDGKGTIRLMTGFAANKAPGSGGKLAMKTEHLVAAFAVETNDNIFAISQLSKIIRFKADEIPSKTGTVQGVNCMSLRHDQVTAVARSYHE